MKPLDLQRKSTISSEGVRSGPVCECGHPPILHGNPEIFGRNTICLVPGCSCERYTDTYAISGEGVRSRGQSIKRCGRRSREATPGSVTALQRVQKTVVVQELATARAHLDRQQIDGQRVDLHSSQTIEGGYGGEGVRS